MHNHVIHLPATHRITVSIGVAYRKKYPGLVDGELAHWSNHWKPELVTVETYKNDKLLRKAVRDEMRKRADCIGHFILNYDWESAERIAPDPELPDACGCELGFGGGLYQPDVYLDIRFGMAFPNGAVCTEILTVPACSDRDDLDDEYLNHIERRYHWKEEDKFFIIKKFWDQARQYLFDYEEQEHYVGPLAGLEKNHDPANYVRPAWRKILD